MSKQENLLALIWRLWGHIRYLRRWQLLTLTLLTLLGAIAELVSLGMVIPFLGILTAPDQAFSYAIVQPVVSWLGLSEPRQLLLPLTIMFATSAIIAGLLRLALLSSQMRLCNSIGNDLGCDIFRRTLYQPYRVHVARNSSEIVTVLMTKINTVVYFILIPLISIFTSSIIIFAVIIFMFFVDFRLTMIATISFGLLYAIVVFITKMNLIKNSQMVSINQSHVTKITQESLGGIRDILIDGLQEIYLKMYQKADFQLRKALSNIGIIGGAPRPIIEALGIVLIAFIAYFLMTRSKETLSIVPLLGVLALASQRLLPLVQQIYAGWASIMGGKNSLKDVLALLDQPLLISSSTSLMERVTLKHKISLVDIHFRYSSDGPWVLRGVNLEIQRGSKIGFIGGTGSGKSTLLDLIMGLLSPTSGFIEVDGGRLNQATHRAWQSRIAHVPQSIYLTDATIAENIAFGVPPDQINMTRLTEVAKKAKISDLIESWTSGYQTYVGERGIRLSGGQRQRIGIARALYKTAEVVIFDEATSSLDNETEKEVMDAVNALGSDRDNLTLIIVAHRLTTLKGCDQIIELSDGIITRVGSYNQIIANVN
jgi:ABC-type multidrug transport system fused ATPase/permease subunit